MSDLPVSLYSPSQVRELDRRAIEGHGIPGYTLMARAGEFAYGAIRERWAGRAVTVVCGAGNNAGDGYVIARLALAAGAPARVIHLVDPAELKGDAARAAAEYADAGGRCEAFDGLIPGVDAVTVDALLGTGLDRPVSGRFAEAVAAINAVGGPVVAVDVPSGLNADTGALMGSAVRADVTATFVGMKCGLLTGRGPEFCGTVLYDSLGVPGDVFTDMEPKARRITIEDARTALAPRPRDAHKGISGHVLIVGGGIGMPGAARLAGEAALRAGAGLVSVATRMEHVAAVAAGRPELMCLGVSGAEHLGPLLERATVVAVGPGLGQTAWAGDLLKTVIGTGLPLVLDADALNLLARAPTDRGNWILTPHPGEAARLLGQDTASIQADRFSAVTELAARYAATAVLKGAGSLVCDTRGQVSLCDAGNPGMAVAGMGDVLTGVIAGLLAQTHDLPTAAKIGVLLHAHAGDDASRIGERGMIATDLLPWIRRHANSAP
jgi:hydroxyethylthiazole kinase-like uncharacterized protein yjeF